jgi:hypothetical protein
MSLDGFERPERSLTIAAKRELDRRGEGKLRTRSPPAELLVERRCDLALHVSLDFRGEVARRRVGVAEFARDPSRFLAPVVPRRPDAFEYLAEPIRPEVGRTRDEVSGGGEKHRRGEPAHVVAFSNPGPAVDIDTDRHEPVVQVGRHSWGCVRGPVHLVALPTPVGAQVAEDRRVARAGLGERRIAPLAPLD